MSRPAVFGFRVDFFYPDGLGPVSAGRYLVAGLYRDTASPVPDVRFYLHRKHKDGERMHEYQVRDQDGKALSGISGFDLDVARVIEYAHEEVVRAAREGIGLPRHAGTYADVLPIPAPSRGPIA